MWPYNASAAVESASHAATAILMLLSVITLLMVGCGVGRGESVGMGVGRAVGRGVGRCVVGSGVGWCSVGLGVGRGVGTRQLYPTTPQV